MCRNNTGYTSYIQGSGIIMVLKVEVLKRLEMLDRVQSSKWSVKIIKKIEIDK